MKIELIWKDDIVGGESIGYEIIAENIDDNKRLGSIRNMLFWGSGDKAIKYNGMIAGERQPGDTKERVKQISFIQKKYKS